jgi:hypothetical protein
LQLQAALSMQVFGMQHRHISLRYENPTMNQIPVTAISVLLTAFFLFASTVKIYGWPKAIFDKQLEFFIKYGLNRALMIAIGFVELFGVIGLWLPGQLKVLGALAILCTSAGAIFFHLRFDTWKDGIPAFVTLVLSGLIVHSLGFFATA